MALIIPAGPGFAKVTTNFVTPASSGGSSGTGVPSGSSNAVGTTTAVITAITHDVELLEITFSNTFTAASVNRMLASIYTDPAGGTSWGSTPIVPNLLCGGTPLQSSASTNRYMIPIWIKSGSSIGVQLRYAHTVALTSHVYVTAWGGHTQPSQWWCGQKVYDIGTSTAASSGTSHTAGTSSVFSTWTNLGSPTTAAGHAVMWSVQPQLSTHTAIGYFFEFGAGSTTIGPPIYGFTNTSEQFIYQGSQRTTFASIPAGTQLQVRGRSGSASSEALDVAAYIVS